MAELRLGPTLEVALDPLRARVWVDVDAAGCVVNVRQVPGTLRRKRVLKPTPEMCKATFLDNWQKETVRVLITSTYGNGFHCARGTKLYGYVFPIFIVCIPIGFLGVCCYNLFHVLRITSTSLDVVFDPIED